MTIIQDHTKGHFDARKLLGNFGFLTFGKVFGDLSTFLMFVVISRAFGQEGIGQYSFAIAFTGFFVVFADFGLYPFAVKQLSKGPDAFQAYYGPIWALRIFLSVTVLAALLATSPFLPFPVEAKLIIIIVGVYQLVLRLVEGANAVFVADEKMHIAGSLDAIFKGAAALTAITIILLQGSLVSALIGLTLVTVVQILVASTLVIHNYSRPKILVSFSSVRRLFLEALPYGASMALSQFQTRIDVVLLGFLIGASASGVYNVGYRIIFLLTIIPNFAGLALLPLATRLYANSKEDFESLYHKSLSMIVIFSLPFAVGLWLVAPDVINLVFGEAFKESVAVLRILSVVLFLNFLIGVMATFLIASDNLSSVLKAQSVAVFLNVVGNLSLIPLLGVRGAAVSTLVAEAVLTMLLVARLKPIVGWPSVNSRLAISGLATGLFVMPFVLLPSQSLFVVIPASVLIYSITLALFKEIRTNEMSTLVGVLKRS